MYRLIRSILFLFPAELAHQIGIAALEILGQLPGVCRWMRSRVRSELSVTIAGLQFPNCVGLAAGLDKNAEAVQGFYALGFGAVEVGTVTPRPQPGNPTPRLFRIPEHHAIINRMGFNNRGAQEMAARIRELEWRPAPLGINIGKNKDTPISEATADYLRCVDELAELGDYVVVNASSPNTPGLRTLQEPEALSGLLAAVRERMPSGKPLFLKIAPDLGLEAVDAIVDVAMRCGVDGLIATNTTIERPFEHPVAKETGGLSGEPVRSKSTAVIRRAYEHSKGKLPIIGVGGVFSAQDAYEKIRAGASLVQVYTGFIYEGPPMVPALLAGISELLKRDGFSSVTEAVGADARGA
ncbi:MAG: quinone-dependent dihydroorotate dehydrogenase [Myxococcaceae bacterium]